MVPLWRRCAELKVPMTILTPVTRLPDLVPLIEANPALKVVIDHMADCPLDRPERLKLLLDLARYPSVFVKISGLWTQSRQAYPYMDAQEQLKRVYSQFGARRLMWPPTGPFPCNSSLTEESLNSIAIISTSSLRKIAKRFSQKRCSVSGHSEYSWARIIPRRKAV